MAGADKRKTLLSQLQQSFAEQYGNDDGVRYFFAPGRVNLIGEHTDYNGGHVFPCALTAGTYAAARIAETSQDGVTIRLFSINMPENGVIETSLEEIRKHEYSSWADYPKGVIAELDKAGFLLYGTVEIAYLGDIPNGSGLSSSASLEVLTGFLLAELFGFDLSGPELAQIGQRAENHYVGVSCGIMDQFASAMGKEGCAIFLDTSDLSYSYVPVKLNGAKLVISNTNKKHQLADSAYNDRRKECASALKAIRKISGQDTIRSLCDLSEEQFLRYRDAIPDPVWRRRARHAILENERTIRAVRVLQEGDLEAFGKLMNESHISLRDDYEVSCRELDVLCEAAWNIPGVIGSRMTGGGFGGCTVSIVEEQAVEAFIDQVGKTYRDATGYDAAFYVMEPGGGPEEIRRK